MGRIASVWAGLWGNTWLWALADQALASTTSILLFAAVGRALSPASLGTFALIMSGRLLLLTATNSLVIGPITATLGRDGSQAARSRLAFTSVVLLALLVPLLLVSSLASIWWAGTLPAALFLAGGVLWEMVRRQQYWLARAQVASFVGFGQAAVAVGMLLLVEGRSIASLNAFLLVTGLLQLVVACLGLDLTSLAAPVRALADWLRWWRTVLWPYARWLALSNGAGYLMGQAHVLIGAALLGHSVVALLEVARQTVAPGALVISGLASPIQVHLARVWNNRTRAAFIRRTVSITLIQVALVTAILLGLMTGGDLLIGLLTGANADQYAPSLGYLPAFAVALLFQAIWPQFSFAILVAGRPRLGAQSRIVSSLLGTTALLIMTGTWGGSGAAWGRVAIEGLTVLGALGPFAYVMTRPSETASGQEVSESDR